MYKKNIMYYRPSEIAVNLSSQSGVGRACCKSLVHIGGDGGRVR